MTATELLVELERRGVRVSARGDRLVTTAPPGAITRDLAEEIKENRDDLLSIVLDTFALLDHLALIGVNVTADWHGLRVEFPPGTYIDTLRESIRAKRYSILAALRSVTDGAGFSLTWVLLP
ncbi:MAG: TubC N-terminal docking domain-related protein [Planctomycetota bacterium]